MDFRKVLILIYFQTYDIVDDINDLLDLTGMNYSIVREFITELVKDGYIDIDKKLKVYRFSAQGKDFLHSECLNSIMIDDLKVSIRVPDSKRKTHIIIPKNFQKRFE